jgi:hypothetical protein
VLGADTIERLPMRKAASVVALTAAVAGCLWIQRTAYRQLRSTKATYGHVVDFVATQSPNGGYLVSDLWWLDQVAATEIRRRRFLFAPEAETGRSIVKRLSDLTVPTVTVFRSTTESPDLSSWSEGTCYFEEERARTSIRDLVAIRLRHRCNH